MFPWDDPLGREYWSEVLKEARVLIDQNGVLYVFDLRGRMQVFWRTTDAPYREYLAGAAPWVLEPSKSVAAGVVPGVTAKVAAVWGGGVALTQATYGAPIVVGFVVAGSLPVFAGNPPPQYTGFGGTAKWWLDAASKPVETVTELGGAVKDLGAWVVSWFK